MPRQLQVWRVYNSTLRQLLWVKRKHQTVGEWLLRESRSFTEIYGVGRADRPVHYPCPTENISRADWRGPPVHVILRHSTLSNKHLTRFCVCTLPGGIEGLRMTRHH
ncbi:hypothetical protein SCLCIDRAFT_252955 [Scleroderma citrinum Foug A]|uniref:Uncharacterized protein n=1 Tax=Scleroderma citrinum Foug A TaxID=1036808 RepID=A0A0C3AP88_9AGAM|nr:hypothetical protein SCLCIDRAFT_252955 [Scleroderma citrinum Foug A]